MSKYPGCKPATREKLKCQFYSSYLMLVDFLYNAMTHMTLQCRLQSEVKQMGGGCASPTHAIKDNYFVLVNADGLCTARQSGNSMFLLHGHQSNLASAKALPSFLILALTER